MNPARRVAFVVPGGVDAVTGGNLYDRFVIGGLRRRGWRVSVVDDPAADADVCVVDSLALRSAVEPPAGGPVVALLHQLPSEAERRPEWRAAEDLVLQAATLVVAVSERLAAAARERAPGARVVVVPPGWDGAASDAPAGGRSPVALCVANSHPGKGVPEAVRAFGRAGLTGWTLAVVGDPARDPEEGRRLRAALREAGPAVRLEGVVGTERLRELYGESAAFVTGSGWEGWPIAVAEAMASALPVVGFDAPGVAELVRDGVDGRLVDVGDVDALAAALRDVSRDPETLGRNARGRARSWPTWRDASARFADALDQIVGSSSGNNAVGPVGATGAR